MLPALFDLALFIRKHYDAALFDVYVRKEPCDLSWDNTVVMSTVHKFADWDWIRGDFYVSSETGSFLLNFL